MFTRTEADGYHFGAHVGARAENPFLTPVSSGGWRVAGRPALDPPNLAWADANIAVPRWLGQAYTRDILALTVRAAASWEALARDDPEIFAAAGRRDGIVRISTDPRHLGRQYDRQRAVGADPRLLTPDDLARRHPALTDAVATGLVAGALEVAGFTVQIHAFAAAVLGLLDQAGVTMRWGQRVTRLHRDRSGAPDGVVIGGAAPGSVDEADEADDEVLRAEHVIISPGAYRGDLLAATASAHLIHGVLGVWLTLSNMQGLRHSLKIARRGHRAEDANATVATGPDGTEQLVIGSGYGWTGRDPHAIDSAELADLHEAVADTARTFFPEPYAAAQRTGGQADSRRFCVRPWTASSLGVFETAAMAGGGVLVVTGGHNTGGFAQAPVIAEATVAALRGAPHPMHTTYHPDRLAGFLRARDTTATPDTRPREDHVIP